MPAENAWFRALTNPGTLVLILVFAIPILAILCGGAVAIVKVLIRHRERMSMIEQGLHPDFPPGEAAESGPPLPCGQPRVPKRE
jgi:hypothetical protein